MRPRQGRAGRVDARALIGIAISVLLIVWVLRGVDLGQVARELRAANLLLLLAAVAATTSGFMVRALRWGIFLHPIRPGTSLRSRFAAVNIGFAANNLLPARMGEFARAWSISRLEPVPVSGALGSLVVERFLDSVAIYLLLLVALLHPSFPEGATVAGQPLLTILRAVSAGLGVLLLIVLLVLFRPGVLLGVARHLSRFLPAGFDHRVEGVVTSFLSGLGALRRPALLAKGLLWSIGFWGWNAVSFWLAFQAFGIDQGYPTALFVQAIIALGVAIPSAPGFFGTFHAAALVGLHEVYGVAEGATLAFAFGYHLGGFIPVTLMGIWYATRIGLSPRDVLRAEREGEP